MLTGQHEPPRCGGAVTSAHVGERAVYRSRCAIATQRSAAGNLDGLVPIGASGG
jgi:hypothetical protein